jgi:hypothetical protein
MRWGVRLPASVGVICVTFLASACTKQVDAAGVSPQTLQDRYGITNAYAGQVATPQGAIKGTIVPVTLPDGRTAQLIVPENNRDYHPAYIQDEQGVHPVALQPGVTREEVVQEPPHIVSRTTEHAHANQHPWEKDLLVIGGSAGGGAAIGAIAGGKKGAAIGAGAGGIGGLIYDLASKKK